jgi:serine/threonine-protein kinase
MASMGEGGVTVNCPCGHSFQASAEAAEKLVTCPACKNAFKPEDPAPQEDTPPASLGQILLDKGWVTPEQLQGALRKQAEVLASGKTIRLGEILVELGILTPEKTREALEQQETAPMRCPSCGKTYTVRVSKDAAKPTCRKCNVALGPATGPSGPGTGLSAQRRPAGEAFDPRLETLIPGYRLLKRLGYGGMGAVFLARQESLNRQVAVKLLPPEFGNDANHVRRFLQEARSAAKVSHENIVGAVDAGEAGGRYFFIMEYVPGETVFKLIRKKGKLPEAKALDVARQVARGLRHAHKNGLIHRDIKPKNLMVTPEGTVKICDFGLAKDITSEDSLTRAGVVITSPAYASPEQCRGDAGVDHRSDMYALGITLFEMLTGKRPFEAETSTELLNLQVSKEPPPLRGMNALVSRTAEELVLKLLKKKPEDRFRSYDDIIAAIDAVLGAAPASLRRAPPPPPARPKIPMPWLVVGGLGAAALLLLSMVILAGSRKPPTPPSPDGGETSEPGPKITDPRTEALFKDARELQERASGNPSQYDSVRSRWKELEARFRGKPDHARFAAGLVEFDTKVEAEAEAASRLALAEAEQHLKAGRPLDAFRSLKAFPPGLARTEAGARVAVRKVEVQKTLDDRWRNDLEAALSDLSRERFETARARLRDLTAWLQEADRAGYPAADGVRQVDALLRKVDEEEVLAAQKKTQPADPGPTAKPPDPKDPKPVTPDPKPGPDPLPALPPGPAGFITVLRTAAHRAEPARRAAAAAAFTLAAPKSSVFRAAALFLSREESAWKMEAPVVQALDEYLAKLPLPSAETLIPDQHLQLLAVVAQKIAGCGAADTEALELFACAHVSEAVAKGAKVPPDLMKQARLAKGPATELWGLDRAVARVEMAHILNRPPGLWSAMAAEAGSQAADFGDRFLAGLCTFKDPSVDLARAADRWKKLGDKAPDPALGALCDSVEDRIKQASVCDSCQGQGRYPCGVCGGTGSVSCTACRGTGRVPDLLGGRSTCASCKQRGLAPCASCGGAKIVKCEGCDGKKSKTVVAGGLFRYLIEMGRCDACSGGGSAFPSAAWPCPACEGLGRPLEAVKKDFARLPAWVKAREGRAIWNALRWLARHQAPEGFWPTSLAPAACPEKGCEPVLVLVPCDVGVTGLALLAFQGAGIGPSSAIELAGAPAGKTVRRAAAWLVSHQQPDGSIVVPGSTKPVLEHLIATAALCAVASSMPAAEAATFQEAARRAVKFALACQHKSSGWGYAAAPPAPDSWVTSWGALALLTARDAGIEIPKPCLAGTLQWFDSMTDRTDFHVAYNPTVSGKIHYLLNATYLNHETLSASAGLVRWVLEGKTSGPVTAAERFLQRDPPNAELQRRDFCYAFWGTMFLAQRHQRKGADWSFWVMATEREILPLQESADTCALGSWAPADRWGMFAGKSYAAALNALTLEVAAGARPLLGTK